jgi:hypothetical protein
MGDLKQILKKERDVLAQAHVAEAFKANPNGYSVFPGCNEPDGDFELGFDACLELLWPVIEAVTAEPLERVGTTKWGAPHYKWTRHTRIEQALAELHAKVCGKSDY